MRRDLPPDVFEVRLHRDHNHDSNTVEICSRMYDIRLAFRLRRMWGDPRVLSDWIERFIGGTVHSWYDSRVGSGSGREMAQALLPHWEREIHHQMERMEHEGRYRADRYDALRYGMPNRYMAWDLASDGPSEDPKAKKKARELLIRNLDATQAESFKKSGEFNVTAKDGKVYAIKTARSFNVVGADGTKYCGQLVDTPIEDQMLAQKLLLEHEPKKFFKNANVSPARGLDDESERQRRMMEMMNMRPGGIIPWHGNI